MGLFRRWTRDRKGFFWTAVAAGLLVAIAAVSNLWPGLFGIGPKGHGPWHGQMIAVILMAAALLDRWRPVRWFLIFSMPPFVVFGLFTRISFRHAPGWALLDAGFIAIGAILLSPPVSRYFRKQRSAWGEGDEAVPTPSLPQTKAHDESILDQQRREREPVER